MTLALSFIASVVSCLDPTCHKGESAGAISEFTWLTPSPYVESITGGGNVPHGVAVRRDGRSSAVPTNSLPCWLRVSHAIPQHNR
jgi:hypothetical protein